MEDNDRKKPRLGASLFRYCRYDRAAKQRNVRFDQISLKQSRLLIVIWIQINCKIMKIVMFEMNQTLSLQHIIRINLRHVFYALNYNLIQKPEHCCVLI